MSKHVPYNNESLIQIVKEETDWSNNAYYSIRKSISTYLYNINDGKCFFCKEKISSDDAGTTEHILSKSKYKMFTYKPENLTFACKTCNRLKNDIEVLVKQQLRDKEFSYDEYPFNSKDYNIIHPYLDDYDKYIKKDDIFYLPIRKSKKAINTIKFYHLDRLTLAEEKIKNNSFINPIFTDILENKSVDVDKEINKCFASGGVLLFIDRELNPNNTENNDIVNRICNLNTINKDAFSQFKKFTKEFPSLDNNKESLLSNEYLMSEMISEELIIVKDILILLKYLTTDIKSRREFLVFISEYSTYNFSHFKSYSDKADINKQLEIIINFKCLLELLMMYEVNNYVDEIKQKINDDIEVLNTISRILNVAI